MSVYQRQVDADYYSHPANSGSRMNGGYGNPVEPSWFSDDDWARAAEVGGWYEKEPLTLDRALNELAAEQLRSDVLDSEAREADALAGKIGRINA